MCSECVANGKSKSWDKIRGEDEHRDIDNLGVPGGSAERSLVSIEWRYVTVCLNSLGTSASASAPNIQRRRSLFR